MLSSRLPSPEQRGTERFPCSLSVQVHAPGEDVLLLTYALNLSATGAFVRANRPLPVGTEVLVELTQRRERVALKGVVVRVEGSNGGSTDPAPRRVPRGIGMRFELDPITEEALERLLSDVGRRELPPAADAEVHALYRDLAPSAKS